MRLVLSVMIREAYINPGFRMVSCLRIPIIVNSINIINMRLRFREVHTSVSFLSTLWLRLLNRGTGLIATAPDFIYAPANWGAIAVPAILLSSRAIGLTGLACPFTFLMPDAPTTDLVVYSRNTDLIECLPYGYTPWGEG